MQSVALRILTSGSSRLRLPPHGAAIAFDTTGTTRIGKYILNHSFMIPGLVSTAVAIGVGMLLSKIIL